MTSEVDGFDEWPTGRLLSTAARLVEQSWSELLESHGVTHAGLIALHTIRNASLSQRDMARASRVTDQTMSRTVEKLARSGMVERKSDPSDDRRVLVSITDSGREMLATVIASEREDSALHSVSDPDALRDQLLQLVRDLSGSRKPATESGGVGPASA
jgi:DNA-binding MarR family transcriptional regulator